MSAAADSEPQPRTTAVTPAKRAREPQAESEEHESHKAQVVSLEPRQDNSEASRLSRSAAAALFQDGLLLVASFLTLSEANAAYQSCKAWLSVAPLERSRLITVFLHLERVLHPAHSVMRRHVDYVSVNWSEEWSSESRLNMLASIAQRMPHATRVGLWREGRHMPEPDWPIKREADEPLWPKAMRSMQIDRGFMDQMEQQAMISALPLCAPLLETFMLEQSVAFSELDLTPLLSLPHLSKVALSIRYRVESTAAHHARHLGVLARLPNLTDVDLYSGSSPAWGLSLQAFATHRTPIRRFHLVSDLSQTYLEEVARCIPLLEFMRGYLEAVTDLTPLASFRSLTELEITSSRRAATTRGTEALWQLSPTLTALKITTVRFLDRDRLHSLLASLTQLRSLLISNAAQLDSVDWLQPMARLERLSIEGCDAITERLVRQVLRLRPSLMYLRFSDRHLDGEPPSQQMRAAMEQAAAVHRPPVNGQQQFHYSESRSNFELTFQATSTALVEHK